MKKIISLVFIVTVCCIGFIYDRNQYYIGRSIIDYKSLPQNLTPDYIQEWKSGYGEEKHFCLIYNGFESFGYGFADVYNLEGFKKSGLETGNKFFVKEIIGYYYDKTRIFIMCLDKNDNVRSVMPYSYKKDIIFVEVPFPQNRKSLKYINTLNI